LEMYFKILKFNKTSLSEKWQHLAGPDATHSLDHA
jgi:hypothetical protein